MLCYPEQTKFAPFPKKLEQISQLIQGALTLPGQEFPQESTKHVLMNVVFEHHLISVDLTMDQPNKSQFCESQPEC